VSSFRERNDRKPRFNKGSGPALDAEQTKRPQRFGAKREDSEGWIWGRHAVEAALANPVREGPFRLVVSPAAAESPALVLALAKRSDIRLERMEPSEIDRFLPRGAAHQGMALRAPVLEGVSLEELAEPAHGVIVLLDQITDPQNVGAVFRSAAAFGARGVVLQDRHAPALAGALAKAATGAIETVPCARVVNLSRALERLADLGWRAVGLDGAATETLAEALDERPTVLVLGSEGEGIRRLVAEHCDALARIPMPGGFESLNVSNAAAVALYEFVRTKTVSIPLLGG
jgi:23S rRNA (guanosine2251-2'-O)-methyltransferase